MLDEIKGESVINPLQFFHKIHPNLRYETARIGHVTCDIVGVGLPA